jgi:hypothetical protein
VISMNEEIKTDSTVSLVGNPNTRAACPYRLRMNSKRETEKNATGNGAFFEVPSQKMRTYIAQK